MALFDKLFGNRNNDLPKDGILMGIPARNFSDEIKVEGWYSLKNREKNPAKEINKEVWDRLSEAARNELKSKGFYCEGDKIDADDDNVGVIQSDDF